MWMACSAPARCSGAPPSVGSRTAGNTSAVSPGSGIVFPRGVWALAEFGTETNHGPLDSRGHSSYLIAGGRYELPWTYTHLSAEYRWRFGAVGDHELLLLFQWLFDFQNPMRN